MRAGQSGRGGLIHRLTYTNQSCLRKKRKGRKRRDHGRQQWERDGNDSCGIGKKNAFGQSGVRWSVERTRKVERIMNVYGGGGGGGKDEDKERR